MKKKTPSSTIAQLMAKFENPQQQTTTMPSNSNVPPKEQKSPLQQPPQETVQASVVSPSAAHAGDMQKNNTASQKQQNEVLHTTPTPQTRVAPPRPPRAHERGLSITTTQDSQASSPRVPPQRPPRARDKELSSNSSQESDSLYKKTAPQKPPRTKAMQQNSSSSQESDGLYKTLAPQKPPRTKAMQQNSSSSQESDGLYKTLAPQKPPRTKAMQQNSSSSQESEGLYATIAPQKPPRTKAMQQNSSSSQGSDDVFTTAAPHKPPLKRHKEQRNATPQEDKSKSSTVTPPRINQSLSQEEILEKVRNNPLVLACKDAVKDFSQRVYGSPNVFEQKLTEIENNPALGESLSCQVAARPKLVGPLAGKKVFGVKSQTRKNAEENISALCLALENYADSVKQARKSALLGNAAIKTYRRMSSMSAEEMAEDLQKLLNREKETAPLSQKEIARRVRSSTMVKYCHAEITYFCSVAYGDPGALQYRLEEIDRSPSLGDELAWQVTTAPHLFGKLAGRNFHGLKNKARKDAEEALSSLASAIEGYAEALKHAKENILENHQQQQAYTLSRPLDKNLQQQQDLSLSPQQFEHSPENAPQKTAEASLKQAEKRNPEKGLQQQDLPNPHRKLERSQGNAQQKAAVTSLKKAEKRNPEKDLQQQDLSNSHKKLEHSSENAHQKAAEVSLKQAEKI
ncbi:BID domain-containing T4SS effector [Bartonella machadoae]|uniref:BID domain-containing T4SS effector n=1 Tax=Bartonella machadoae TaxID=2893471 RepID=UPI001F4D1EF2|nr:BID domain-containing T4SS effector [Bartonella machadoae]UNE53791.1 BID domain-containing T4SS effector [Bartonella machadoae]